MRKKLALYYRLSQEDVDLKSNKLKDESNSIHSQRLLSERYLQNHPELRIMTQEEFIDDGFTGANFERPAFQRLIEKIKAGEIQCIIVKDLSRLGRDYLQVGDYLEHIFPFLGVRCISINDHYDSDNYVGTTGGLDVAFRNLIYQKYSQDLSQKVKSAMHLKMRKGEYVNICPYGYTKKPGIKHKMFIDPIAAPIVREIFLAIIAGKKTTEIAVDLNERKIPTPQQHKGYVLRCQENDIMWSHQAVLRIVQDYKYTGAMINFKCRNDEIHAKSYTKIPKSEWLITEGKHEAIVTHDEYETANQMIRKVKKSQVNHSDQRDRIYYCGHCGRKLRKTFGVDEYFSCATQLYVKDCSCAEILWSKSKIEQLLLTIYRSQLSLIKEKAEKSPSVQQGNPLQEYARLAKQYSREIASCETEKLVQYEAYRDGKIDKDAFLNVKSELLTRKERIQNQLEEIEQKMQIERQSQAEKDKVHIKAKECIPLLRLTDEELKDEMLDAIERVIVYSNSEIMIKWKDKDLFSTLRVQGKGA